MTLGNMRELGVHRLIASCLNDASLKNSRNETSPKWNDTSSMAASTEGEEDTNVSEIIGGDLEDEEDS
jgi:hypothetical protein